MFRNISLAALFLFFFRSTSLAAILFGLWMLLSGHYTTLLLIIGGISAVFVVAIGARMGVIDREGHPIRSAFGALFYWPWLLWQILRANLDVSRRILSSPRAIDPELFMVRASQKSQLGQVIYANSITLTPGTVTIEVENGEFLIHALDRSHADEIRSGRMDRLVYSIEGSK